MSNIVSQTWEKHKWPEPVPCCTFPSAKLVEPKTLGDLLREKLYGPKVPQEVNQQQEKEKMCRLSASEVAILISLAGKGEADDLAEYLPAMGPDVSDALKDLLANEAAEAAKSQARVIRGVMKETDSLISSYVSTVRSLRAQEALFLKRLRKLKRAQQYAKETGNFLPQLALHDEYLGNFSTDGLNKELLTIPDGWTSKSEEVKAST